MVLTIALFALLALGYTLIRSAIKLAKKSQPAQQKHKQKRKRTKPPANWHKATHRANKQKQKVYVAPVIKRKWRTPRRSSH